jgi:hypothetical protein
MPAPASLGCGKLLQIEKRAEVVRESIRTAENGLLRQSVQPPASQMQTAPLVARIVGGVCLGLPQHSETRLKNANSPDERRMLPSALCMSVFAPSAVGEPNASEPAVANLRHTNAEQDSLGESSN